MRLLAWIVLLGSVACTRINPSYGDGGGEGGGTEQGDDDDPSSASLDGSASIGEEASADEQSSIDTGVDESAGETGSSGPCCLTRLEGGCEIEVIEACVCEGMRSCCDIEWSKECVNKAVTFCNAECEVAEEGGSLDTGISTLSAGTSEGEAGSSTETSGGETSTTAGERSDCCVGHDGFGCDNPEIEDCVCVTNENPACCDLMWTDACAAEAVECGAFCGDA